MSIFSSLVYEMFTISFGIYGFIRFFDMVHFGHANALRQGKQMGDVLVVAIQTDAHIAKHKRQPVYTQSERYKMIQAIKWVDEVVEAPEVTTPDTLRKYDCDFCVHGDDLSITLGQDSYHLAKEAKKYKECKRTDGISTTDLLNRIVLTTRNGDISRGQLHLMNDVNLDWYSRKPWIRYSQFLSTTQMLGHFASGKEPKPGDKIVYAAGAFDLFHAGHVDFLEKAAAEGDFLIVGLHTDAEISRRKGVHYPITNLQERTLNVLSYKYVSEVVIGAPYTVTQDLIDRFKVDVVCHGMTPIRLDVDGSDPYAEPKKAGKFKLLDSGSKMTTQSVIERIIKHRADLETRKQPNEEK